MYQKRTALGTSGAPETRSHVLAHIPLYGAILAIRSREQI